MNKIPIFIALFLLSACTRTVYLTAKCPAPTIEPEPNYSVLTADATPKDFVSWCIIGQKMSRDALRRCNKRLESYKIW